MIARKEIPEHFGDAFGTVAIAASAGGLKAIIEILSGLQADFPASIIVVQHHDPMHRSLPAEMLNMRTNLKVKDAEEGEYLARSTIYISRPDRHLLVNPDGSLSPTSSEPVHFVRPSADILFEFIEASYRDRAIIVVLTGTGSDGSAGVQAIKRMNSSVIVQDENTAEFSGMPSAAVNAVSVDFVLPLDEIAHSLIALVMRGDKK